MISEKGDKELEAIKTIIGVLSLLDDLARHRVLDYVFERLDMSKDYRVIPQVGSQASIQTLPSSILTPVQDIRTLTQQKQPKNDSEMVAIVAYYLSELAPQNERKDTLNKNDVLKYFKQAGFRLPKHPRMTLPIAKNGGYFDQTSAGEYRMNPVGYNLVVHTLPSSRTTEIKRRMTKNPPKKS